MADNAEPDYSFWQEEHEKRLKLEDALARKEQDTPIPDGVSQGHLVSLDAKRDEWAAVLKVIVDTIEEHGRVIDDAGIQFISTQCMKMRDMIVAGHRQAMSYRAKGRVWRGLRNRSEQYILEFRRATQYYFTTRKENPNQDMDPAIFQTAVADWHAALTTTLRVLREALGEEESQREAEDVEYDSDSQEPVINLRRNHSTPQQFSKLVEEIIEMVELAKKVAWDGNAGFGYDRQVQQEYERTQEALKEISERMERLERERRDFLIARGTHPPDQDCAKEAAEIERLDNELRKCQDKLEELTKQCNQQTEYIDAISRGLKPAQDPDDPSPGVLLSSKAFDELCRHFESYHANAEESQARNKQLEDSLKNVILHPNDKNKLELENKLRDEIHAANNSLGLKDELVKNLRREIRKVESEKTKFLEESQRYKAEVEKLIVERNKHLQDYKALEQTALGMKKAEASGIAIFSDAEKEQLEQQVQDIMEQNMVNEKNIHLAQETIKDLQEDIAKRDAKIQSLTIMLDFDDDISRNRQEKQDLREKIIALEHYIDNELARQAIENYVDSDGPGDPGDPGDPSDKAGNAAQKEEIARLKKQLEKESKTAESKIAKFKDQLAVGIKERQQILVETEAARAAAKEESDKIIANLRTTIADLQKQITDINATNVLLRANMQAQIKALTTENQELKENVPEEVAPNGPLAKALDDLENRDLRIAFLDSQISEASKRHEQQIKEIQARLDEARLNANGISPDDLRVLRRNLADCRKHHDDDQITISNLEAELDAYMRRVQHQDRQLQAYAGLHRHDDRGAAAKIARLELEKAAMEEELRRAKEEREKKADEDRRKAEEAHQKELDDAAGDVEIDLGSVTSHDSNEEINKQHIDRIRRQTEELKKLKNEHLDMEIRFNVSQKTVEALQKQRKDLQEKLRECRRQKKDLTDQNLQAAPGAPDFALDNAQRVSDLEARINELETEITVLEESSATLQLQRDAAIAENEENKQKMADLQTAHDIMAGEGPKLGLKRIKKRIALQGRATRARNLAAEKSKEVTDEAARADAKKARKDAIEQAKKDALGEKDDNNSDEDQPSPPLPGAGVGAVGGNDNNKQQNDPEPEPPKDNSKRKEQPASGRKRKTVKKTSSRISKVPQAPPKAKVTRTTRAKKNDETDDVQKVTTPSPRVTRSLAKLTLAQRKQRQAEKKELAAKAALRTTDEGEETEEEYKDEEEEEEEEEEAELSGLGAKDKEESEDKEPPVGGAVPASGKKKRLSDDSKLPPSKKSKINAGRNVKATGTRKNEPKKNEPKKSEPKKSEPKKRGRKKRVPNESKTKKAEPKRNKTKTDSTTTAAAAKTKAPPPEPTKMTYVDSDLIEYEIELDEPDEGVVRPESYLQVAGYAAKSQKSSFVINKPVSRPKVTFNEDKYMIEPEDEPEEWDEEEKEEKYWDDLIDLEPAGDESEATEESKNMKRASPPSETQSDRVKRART